MPEEKTKDPELVRTYEIAYLVEPSVSEEKALVILLPVKDMLASRNANIIAEEVPRLRRLAYPIRVKHAGAVGKVFESAFFGWLRFEADTETALAAKKLSENLSDIFRFLFVKPAATLSSAPSPVRMFVRRAAPEPVAFEKRASATEPPKPAVSDEELDRRIEELVGA